MTAALRIVHVYKDYFPVLGGIENHIRLLAEAQAAAGHAVQVLVAAPGWRSDRSRLAGVDIVRTGRVATVASMPLSPLAPVHFARLDADIVHVHSPYPAGEISAHVLAAHIPRVITHHSDVIRQKRLLRIYGPMLRRVLAGASAIVATSPRYIDSSPWLSPPAIRARCRVVPLGIDVERFADDHDAAGAHGRVGDGVRLLFVGALRHYKGLDVLLDALASPAMAEGAAARATLDVVGSGPQGEAWREHAQRLGLGARVRFLGQVADEDLPAAYAGADVVVLPSTSRAEAFGAVLLEAMASARPVVSTELGTGTSWVNQDGTTGLVVAPSDARALAAALARLCAEPETRRRMGAAGRERARGVFSRAAMVAGVEAVYTDVLSRR